MWPEDSHRQKEWPVVLAPKELYSVGGGAMVDGILRASRPDAPVSIRASIPLQAVSFCHWHGCVRRFRHHEELVKRCLVVKGATPMVMEDLPGAGHCVAMVSKVPRDGHRVRQCPPPVCVVPVDPGARRPQARQRRHPGRIAGRRGRIRSREQCSPFCQPLKVWCTDGSRWIE